MLESNDELTVPKTSMDGSVSLNDDLAMGLEVLSPPVSRRMSGSFRSHRTSLDNDSSFSSAYFNIVHGSDDANPSDTAPLGPNSIFELTVGSDLARLRRQRAPKTSISLNGGGLVVNNVNAPTLKEIPQIQLAKLHSKVSNSDLEKIVVGDLATDYKRFELSYKQLTEDTLHRLDTARQHRHPHDNNSDRGTGVGLFSASSSVVLNDTDDISSIPAVYLDENFRLDDPRVFSQVIEGCTILADDEDKIQLSSNTELQEKLSHYLDIVEVKLIQEISKSLDSFFNTLGDIQQLLAQSKDCTATFERIGGKLEFLEQNQAKTGLEILHKLQQKKEIESFESLVLQLQYVVQFFELANKAFQNGNHSACLNHILTVENLILGTDQSDLNPKLDRLADLSAVPALFQLKRDLQLLKNECSKGYTNDFIDLLLQDLKYQYSSVPTHETLTRLYVSMGQNRSNNLSINRSYQNIEPSTKDRLKTFIQSLSQSEHIANAYQSYQVRIIAEIKDIIKTNLPKQDGELLNAPSRDSPAPDMITSGSNSLSSNIRSLSPKEFEDMMQNIYATLSECLRRLTVHQKLLLDLALTSLPPTSHINVMALDITVAINKAIELTQIRLTKVINVRLEQIADLSLPFYLRLYSLSLAYLQECESINPGFANGPGSSLNDWVKNHVAYFIHRHHLNSMKRLASECDKELWKEVIDTSALREHQTVLDEIIGYAEYVETGKLAFSGDSWLLLLDFREHQEQEATKDQEQISRLTVQGQYLVPKVAFALIKMTRDSAILSKVFVQRAHTVEVNLLNLFKLVNSKTSQAVLNAGATRTAGLKHITTKHLALCIQFVEFCFELLTRTQKIFPNTRASSPSGQPEEPTFEKVLSNYRDHENELFSKLVSIMHDRTVAHCQNITTIDWSVPLKHPQQCHSYMETLVKETSTVSKVLLKYLQEPKCAMVLLQIFDNYKKLLVECYCTKLTQFKDFNEKHLLLKDIDYFRVKLCEVPGYGNSGLIIWENVNSLPTIEDTQMEEKMRKNISNERTENGGKNEPETKPVESKIEKTEVQEERVEERKENEEKKEGEEKVQNGEKEEKVYETFVPEGTPDVPENGEQNEQMEEKSEEKEEKKDEQKDGTKTEVQKKVDQEEEGDNSDDKEEKEESEDKVEEKQVDETVEKEDKGENEQKGES